MTPPAQTAIVDNAPKDCSKKEYSAPEKAGLFP